VAVPLPQERQPVSEKQAKQERASSNPFELLQNRNGGQGLGYSVPEGKVPVTIKKVADSVRHLGRPRRSTSGKRHDGTRLNLYIRSKLSKESLLATRSLATTAACIANSYGVHVQNTEHVNKYIKFENEKRFLYDFCYNYVPSFSDLSSFSAKLRFSAPSVEKIEKLSFNDISYLGRISPELLRLMVMYRVSINSNIFKVPIDTGSRRVVWENNVVSEIRQSLQSFGQRVLRVVRARVFSVDPEVRGDNLADNSIDSEMRELYGA